MIDFSKWKESQATVTTLLLDHYNPRIPDSGENLSQRDLIADLVENDKVYDLAKSIVENGFYPIEALIIVIENNKKYVLEGNRRLAALKMLISPDSAPDDSWKRRFKALANRIDPNTIRRVKVFQAPSRETAASVIMSKHTRNQIESWSPLMQAKFYRNLIDSGLNINELAEQYNIQVSEIADALQRHTMYSIACTLDLPEDVKKIVLNPREFPITTLERLYKNPTVIEFLGINFDINKQIIGNITESEFKKGYSKIITDVATGKIHSRSLNTKTEIDNYIISISENRPDLEKKGEFTAASLLQNPVKIINASQQIPVKVSKPKPIPRSLIPQSFQCDVANDRINNVFNELGTCQ